MIICHRSSLNKLRMPLKKLSVKPLPDQSVKEAQSRARQNVVLELGYFAGRIGRNRVLALKRGQLELPSDFLGVAYTLYDELGHWKYELVRELKAADFEVDANLML